MVWGTHSHICLQVLRAVKNCLSPWETAIISMEEKALDYIRQNGG